MEESRDGEGEVEWMLQCLLSHGWRLSSENQSSAVDGQEPDGETSLKLEVGPHLYFCLQPSSTMTLNMVAPGTSRVKSWPGAC